MNIGDKIEVSNLEALIIVLTIGYILLQPTWLGIHPGETVTLIFKEPTGERISNALCYCNECDPQSKRTDSRGKAVYTWVFEGSGTGGEITSPYAGIGCYCPGTNDAAELDGRLSELTHTATLTKECAGAEPDDGEMKCTSVGAYRYSRAKHTFELAERCGTDETCVCDTRFNCYCKSAGCKAGWACKGSGFKGYLNTDCSWADVVPCAGGNPFCVRGDCVECLTDTHCNDYDRYTIDKCVSNNCVHTPITTTTTTLRRTTTTTMRGVTTTTMRGVTTTTMRGVTTTTIYIPPAFCNTDAGCDDGDPCTLDECIAGECKNTFQDKDDDGVCDAKDECPDVYGVPEKKGCPAEPFPWIWVGLGVGLLAVVLIIALMGRKEMVLISPPKR